MGKALAVIVVIAAVWLRRTIEARGSVRLS